MKIRRSGKCSICSAKVLQEQEFKEQIDMFGKDEPAVIRDQLKADILAWRDEPILCEEHCATIQS